MRNHPTRKANQLYKASLIVLICCFKCQIIYSQYEEVDSLSEVAEKRISSVKNLASEQVNKNGISFSQRILNSPKNYYKTIDNLISNTKEQVASSVNNFFKNPLSLKSVSMVSANMVDTSYFNRNKLYYRSNMDFSSQLSLSGIPVDISFQRQSWTDINEGNSFQISFQFDKEKYLEQLKNNLKTKLDLSTLTNLVKNPLDEMLARAKETLITELKGLSKEYKGLLDKEVLQITTLQNLFTADVKSLKEKLLSPALIKSISEKQNQLTVLQQQINNGEKVDASQLGILYDSITKMKGLQDLIKKIEQHKAKWEQSGLIKKLKEFDLFKQVTIANIMNDPSFIASVARQKLSLSGLQRFFLNVKHLDIGQNSISLSPLSFQNLLSKGLNTEYLSNKRSLMLIVGKQTDFNSILDYAFTNSPFTGNGLIKAFGIGLGQDTRSTTNFSISSFSQAMTGMSDRISPDVLRQVLVTTISKRMPIGEKGMINVELSRSATQYNPEKNLGDSGLPERSGLARILSTENFMGNTAISVKYADELTEKGLSYHIQFNKTANGYANPGNSYLSAGSTEFGTGIRKSLLKNKMLVTFRGNTRVFKYNELQNAVWLNTNMFIDAKWKMKRGQYFAIRYQPVKMLRKEQGNKTLVSSVERITADGNIYKKIGKFSYRNFISLAGQKNTYALNSHTIIRSISLMISSFQHFLIGKRMIYANLNYNHSDNVPQYPFLNSSFYAETGYNYKLGKNISASSGLIYNRTVGWYSQAGIRQTISGEVGERFSINIYIDLKKNLKLLQPLWNDPVRADVSLRYFLKNKN